MKTVRRADERGETRLDWLDSKHSFSFGGYQDPAQMGFRTLRVINDDRVAPSGGFATHGHRDMEILTWVLEGQVAHRDSMGNVQTVDAGEMQRMTAGTGVTHSEFNPSDSDELRFLQIWILPEREGLEPGYEQRHFETASSPGEPVLIASPDGRNGSLTVHQDVNLHAATLKAGQELTQAIPAGRHLWLQVATGTVSVDGESLPEGAGLAVSDESSLTVRGESESEILLFDLA
jgi:redox-sensitive bicupin YhaK (pirin superfamily)